MFLNWIILILGCIFLLWILYSLYSDYLIYKEYLTAEENMYDSLDNYVIYSIKKGKAEGLFSKAESRSMNRSLKIIKKDGSENFIRSIEKNPNQENNINFFNKIVNDYEKYKNNFDDS